MEHRGTDLLVLLPPPEIPLALRVCQSQKAQGWRERETIQGWAYRLFTIPHYKAITATLFLTLSMTLHFISHPTSYSKRMYEAYIDSQY